MAQGLWRRAFHTGVRADCIPGRLDALRVMLEVGGAAGDAVLLGDRNLVSDELALDPFDPGKVGLRDRRDGAALARMDSSRTPEMNSSRWSCSNSSKASAVTSVRS